VAYAITRIFALSPPLAIGLMLLAASPGGAVANVFSHLARGDVALNVTLTAVNSLLALAWLPLVVNWSLAHFLGEGQYVRPPPQKLIEVWLIIVAPIAVGMVIRVLAPAFALRAERPVRALSMLLLAALVAVVVYDVRADVPGYFAAVGLACLLFNVVSMAVGYFAPRALRLGRAQAVAISLEVGVHNCALAVFVALNILGDGTMAVPAAVYSLIMFVTAATLVAWLNATRSTNVSMTT
jgi:bile acid:Na+ symporter, BASS family